MRGEKRTDNKPSALRFEKIKEIIHPQLVKTALSKLKEKPNFKIPVIALTADAVSGAREKYIDEGFTDYIAKPFNKEQIKEKLDLIFNLE